MFVGHIKVFGEPHVASGPHVAIGLDVAHAWSIYIRHVKLKLPRGPQMQQKTEKGPQKCSKSP